MGARSLHMYSSLPATTNRRRPPRSNWEKVWYESACVVWMINVKRKREREREIVLCLQRNNTCPSFGLQAKLFWGGERQFGDDWVQLVDDVAVGSIVRRLVLDGLEDSNRSENRQRIQHSTIFRFA